MSNDTHTHTHTHTYAHKTVMNHALLYIAYRPMYTFCCGNVKKGDQLENLGVGGEKIKKDIKQ